jgi:hypothetical protein
MSIINYARTMDKSLRVMLIATSFLVVIQIGQFDNRLEIVFNFLALFFIPTAVILSAALLISMIQGGRRRLGLLLLGGFNLFLAIALLFQIIT